MRNNKIHQAAVLTAAGLLGSLLTTSAFASPIVGTLQVAGSVQVSATAIDFIQPSGAPYTDGELDITANLNTGTFSVFNIGSGVTQTRIKDLSNGPQVGTLSSPVNNFVVFPSNSSLFGDHLDLTYISPGSDSFAACSPDNTTATVGQSCSPPGSPFNLQNLNNTNGTLPDGTACYITVMGVTTDRCSVAINFAFGGNAVTGSNEVSPFTGSLSTQLQSMTFQDVLTQLGTNNGTGVVGSSYSGTFIANAPEPGTFTMLFLGAGMIVLGYAGKKHHSSQQ